MPTQANSQHFASSLDLSLIVTDRNVLGYLAQFVNEDTQTEKALEALKVGVIAIQSASPTLDTTVVQAHFTELEANLRGFVSAFERRISQSLDNYFEDKKGVVPRSLEEVFGESGALSGALDAFLDPESGQITQLFQTQFGPESKLGKSLDPENKQGLLAVVEARIQELVEAKLNDVLEQFSLDKKDSAMSRLHELLRDAFASINKALGHNDGRDQEAQKGHVKGIRFEQELYDEFFADLCVACEDDPALVARTPGKLENCKTGDLQSTLGESTGAPGVNIIVEVKDRELKLKDARQELQDAKINRNAAIGIFVWRRGTEPVEVGDFRRIGDDFYVTVDLDELRGGRPLLYFEAAYRIARAMAVASVRKESAEQVDLSEIENHVESLGAWSERIADMVTKARTVQNNGRIIEQCATELKDELDRRIKDILATLRA